MGSRLSKHYKQTLDGKVVKFGGTEMSRGEYETITIEAADPPAVLAEIGSKIDVLNFREAIGLGVVKDGLPPTGDITTKAAYERRPGQQARDGDRHPAGAVAFRLAVARRARPVAVRRRRKGRSARDPDRALPRFAEVAALVRPSARPR